MKQTNLPQFEPVTATLGALVAEGERLVQEQVGGGCIRSGGASGSGGVGAIHGASHHAACCHALPCLQIATRPPRPLSLPACPAPQDHINSNKLSEEYLRVLREAKKRGRGPGVGMGGGGGW